MLDCLSRSSKVSGAYPEIRGLGNFESLPRPLRTDLRGNPRM